MKSCSSLLSAAALALRAFSNAQTVDLNIDPSQPQATACGIINHQYLTEDYQFFEAPLARECLTSVPFDPAVATRFIAWFNQTLQFYSLPAFLKDPPQSYRQPAADVFAQLQQIQDRVDSEYYRNQYVFDADVQALIRDSHDAHLSLVAGALGVFTFGAPFQLVSVSKDGKEEPKVYSWYLIKNYLINGTTGSAITSINDVPVIDYLEQFAAKQSFGMLEPHADWNNLMRTPAMQTMGYRSVFSSAATFYPDDGHLSLKYEDRAPYDAPWLAEYTIPGFTGPLQTGGDFYNIWVLGNLPANYNESYSHYQANDTQQSTRRMTKRDSELKDWHSTASAYPENTISHQADLGVDTSGYVTGYLLEDISTAVLSLPSFDQFGTDDTFETAIADFVNNATLLQANKLIIDLQQNLGGQESYVFEAIRQLFPSISPPAVLSRMRSHPLGDYLGQTMTTYFNNLTTDDDDYPYLVEEEWAITDRINFDTKQNFTSWEEFYGPLTYNGGTFSKIEEYNLTSESFDDNALAYNSTPYTSNGTYSKRDYWSPSDIVILTDGLCSSSCSLFVEIATQQFGVRTVVVGGNTKATPMQAASGTRGALLYGYDDIDTDFAIAEAITSVPYTSYLNDTGMAITIATINLRDQIRPTSNGVPNQMLYIPANCRIYWTLANFNDFNRLWHDVSSAIYKDQSICIGGYQTTSAPTTVSGRTIQRSRRSMDRISNYISEGISLMGETVPTDELHEGYSDGIGDSASSITYCSADAQCGTTGKCRQSSITCKFGCNTRGKPCQQRTQKTGVCAPLITVGGGTPCTGTFELLTGANKNGKQASAVFNNKKVQGDAPQKGYCIPNSSSAGTPTCPS